MRREDAHAELQSRNIGFAPFSDLEKAVKDDVALLQRSKLVADGVAISGWVYAVETGRTTRII